MGKKQVEVHVIAGGKEVKLPAALKDKLSEIGKMLGQSLEGEMKPQDAKFLMELKGSEFHVEMEGRDVDFANMFLHVVQEKPEFLEIFKTVVEHADHMINCDCENCGRFRSKFEKNAKKN